MSTTGAAHVPTTPSRAKPLLGQRVAFTGRLATMRRAEAERLVRTRGGTPVSTVSRRTSLLVVGMRGWALRDDGRISRKIEEAEAGRARGWRIRLIGEQELIELAGGGRRAGGGPFTLEQAAEACGVEAAQVRRWEFAGLVRSRDGFFDFQDIVSLRTLAELRGRGVALATVGASLERLRGLVPGVDRPLAQLRLLEAGGEILTQLGDALLMPCGQQVMDFEGCARVPAGRPVGLGAPTVEALLDRGVALEEDERYEEASAAYRRAIELDGSSAEARFNLANALRALGRDEEAAGCYRDALELDPGLSRAWYNLAGVHEEAGRMEEAIDALCRAVRVAPEFADARFNLAACLDDAGRPGEAAAHWRAYLSMDPAGEWAAHARSRLRACEAGGCR